MSVNLVSRAATMLSPGLTQGIACTLKIGGEEVARGAVAAIPILFSSIAEATESVEGAKRLDHVLGRDDAHMLDALLSDERGAAAQLVSKIGIGTLKSVIGRSLYADAVYRLADFAGLELAESASLIGLLTPVVISVLGEQKFIHRLDAQGIALLLASQQQNIHAALPRAFRTRRPGTRASLLCNVIETVSEESFFPEPERRNENRPSPWMCTVPILALVAFGWMMFTLADKMVPAKTSAMSVHRTSGIATERAVAREPAVNLLESSLADIEDDPRTRQWGVVRQ